MHHEYKNTVIIEAYEKYAVNCNNSIDILRQEILDLEISKSWFTHHGMDIDFKNIHVKYWENKLNKVKKLIKSCNNHQNDYFPLSEEEVKLVRKYHNR